MAESKNAPCAACVEHRPHSDEEWKNHPLRGHGCTDGRWSHPDAEAAHIAEVRRLKEA